MTFLIGTKFLYRFGSDVDEGTQAIVLAEIAARGFVARRAVFNLANSIQTDESCLLTISPQTQCLLRGANRARFTAVLVHNNFWLLACRAETIANEIYFGLYHGEVILRSSL